MVTDTRNPARGKPVSRVVNKTDSQAVSNTATDTDRYVVSQAVTEGLSSPDSPTNTHTDSSPGNTANITAHTDKDTHMMATAPENTAPKKQASFYYRAGLDIGNGYVKGLVGLNPHDKNVRHRRTVFADDTVVPIDEVDMPSIAAVMTRNNYVPTPDEKAYEVVRAKGDGGNTTEESMDFFNSVALSFDSPMVDNTDRHVIGQRALNSGGYLDDFAVTGSTASKAEQSLSKVLVLSVIAAKAIKDYVGVHGSLPGPNSQVGKDTGETSLTVHTVAAFALPISEFVAHRDSYVAAFTGTGEQRRVHTVTVNNFETPVTVNIVFDDVAVIAEGASAQYAISNYGVPLITKMLADVRKQESEPGEYVDPEITAADVFGADNSLGIDIGEGTVNFPVMTGKKFNTDSSATYSKGYGTVLEAALDDMASSNIRTFTSRKQLADFLLREPSAMKRNQYNQVKAYVDKQIDYFVDDMVQHFGKVLTQVGANTEVAYVYGGGSGPMREALYPKLAAKVSEMTSFGGFPVLYLDSSYSRGLNREGLLLAADARAAKLAAE